MKTGRFKLKYFNSAKKFGFLDDGKGGNIFFHVEALKKAGLKEKDLDDKSRKFSVRYIQGYKGFKVIEFLCVNSSKSNTKKNQEIALSDNFAIFLNKPRYKGTYKQADLSKLDKRKTELEEYNFKEIPFKEISKQQEKHLTSLCLEDEYFSESKKVEDKIVHGLGNASIYETGFSLHHIYGVPYLPASSIKGMLRSYIIQEMFDGSEKNALENSKAFCYLFGCSKETILQGDKAAGSEKEVVKSCLGKDYQGELIFFDAFPVDPPEIKIDLLNTHYPTYYNSTEGAVEPPADWDSPNIVNFLTLCKPTFMFRFGLSKRVAAKTETEKYTIKQEISWKDSENENEKKEAEKKESIENLFTQALQNHGLGAKTAVGYGFFK